MVEQQDFRTAHFTRETPLTKEQLAAIRSGDACWLHSWDTSSVINGPGTRITLFMAGCELRCQYCHNPDSVFTEFGSFVTLDEAWERVLRFRRVYETTGGGVTASGGEPTFQWNFLRKLFTRAKEAGIHTTLDSSGYLGRLVKDEDMELIDLVMLDLKEGTPEGYRKTTTRRLQPSVDFGDRLDKAGVALWGRYVLVPGLTDSDESIDGIANIATRWQNLDHIDILPFHQYGRDKWHELGLVYQLEDTPEPTKEQVDRARRVFEERGLKVYTS